MRKFWGFYDNGKYRVGCNGATVYVYDQNNNELARFKDIAYAYKGKFVPNTNIIVIKSTGNYLAIYDLDELKLLKKILVTRIGAQDEGFAFSPDGKYLYNIEKPKDSTETQLAEYNTNDFSASKIYFSDRKDLVLSDLEFDKETGMCYILGFMRDKEGVYDYGIIGQFLDGEIVNVKKLKEKEYDYIYEYKEWERTGFTEKALNLSSLRELKEIRPITLKGVYNAK